MFAVSLTPAASRIEREITLGCKDPITQQHRLYRLMLEEGYSLVDAKNYLSIMQE